MYSFDHDLEEFVAIGLGTVSADGSVIESNPGVGVVKAGWHCGSQITASAMVDPYAAYPTSKKLAADQTALVTSAYRNPERNERIGSTPTSNHMLGRALDISVNNIGPKGSQSRGMAFYIAWRAIHGANPGDTGYTNATNRLAGVSPNVNWADYWQLEGKNGATDVVLKSHSGWVNTDDALDIGANLGPGNGVADGYDRTFHLHIADRPNYGVHK